MAGVTLKQLRYVEALSRHGHFGRAANACAITQPALSMQIRELEETLGTALFERGARHVTLTGFGEEFAARARQIMRSVDELDSLARAARDRLAGPLRLGVIPTVAPYLLPTLIRQLTANHPGLDVRVRETVTQRLIEALADGELDAAIVALPVSEPALTEVALFDEEFLLVRPVGEASRPVPDVETLREMRLLLLEEGHCFREQALSFCETEGKPPREIVSGSALATLVQMVGAGIGVTLIPRMAVAVETRSAPVCVTRFPEPRPARTVGMIWRRTSPLAAQFETVSEAVRQSAETLREADRSPHGGTVDGAQRPDAP